MVTHARPVSLTRAGGHAQHAPNLHMPGARVPLLRGPGVLPDDGSGSAYRVQVTGAWS